MLTATSDRSIMDDAGRILFYSAERYLREIVDTDGCFVCGANPQQAAFNDEHVIPDWIQRRYRLHRNRILLPGGREVTYDRYKVPCCVDCNTRMGKLLERPIADVTAEGYDSVVRALLEPNPFLLYAWLNLVYLKVHLKDRNLRLHADERARTGNIAELYYWPGLHHVHCVARSPYTGVHLSSKALGSMFVVPARTGSTFGDFDYSDYYPGMAMLLRLGETAFICVLNDAGGAASILAEDIKKIKGPLSPQQCRELLAHASYANMLIENRPSFHTAVDPRQETLTISARVGELVQTRDFVAAQFGDVLHSVLDPDIYRRFDDPEDARARVRSGHATFLFDKDGKFIADGL